MELTRDFFVKTGKKGGRALVKRRGKKYMAKLASKGAEARWKDHKKAVKK